MDLLKTGGLIAQLRREQGMTQKDVADQLGICAKTVSKWETGHGFPDVSFLSQLSQIFQVDLSQLLEGELPKVRTRSGNMKKTKFYVCQTCGNLLSGVENAEISCCGRRLSPLQAKEADPEHDIQVSKIENEFYLEFSHPMTKEHFIGFVSYVRFDRVLTVHLYPEQDAAVRFPIMYGGKIFYYCNRHGLFVYQPKSR